MIIKLFSFQEDNPTYAESLAFLQKAFPAESNCCRKYFPQKAFSEEIISAEKSFLTIESIFCRKHFLKVFAAEVLPAESLFCRIFFYRKYPFCKKHFLQKAFCTETIFCRKNFPQKAISAKNTCHRKHFLQKFFLQKVISAESLFFLQKVFSPESSFCRKYFCRRIFL